ncbi:MAG: hypothetical protein MUE53_05905, partial [Chitinophagales bacterium]|nr:hypothetical protein [Chitinophagales bacterium]
MRTAKLTLLALLTLATSVMTAQLKVGKNPKNINPNAIFEMESDTSGMLLPRLPLTSTALATPLKAHVAGMTVYNTATAGTGATAVSPGLYYNNGLNWVRVSATPIVSNGLTRSGDSILLGGNLIKATTITQTAAKDSLTFATNGHKLKITGLTTGTTSDSLLTVDPNTGQVKRISLRGMVVKRVPLSNSTNQIILDPNTPADSVPILASYEDTLGKVITVIISDRIPGTSFRISTSHGVGSGYLSYAYNSNLVVANGPQGPPGPQTLAKTNNAISLGGAGNTVVQLGGPLVKPTTIATTAANTLTITGLQSGSVNDSFVTVDPTTGQLKRRSVNGIIMKRVKLNNVNNHIITDPNTPANDIPILASYEDSTGKIYGVSIDDRTPGSSFRVNTTAPAGGYLNYGYPGQNLLVATGPQGPPGTSSINTANNGLTANGNTLELGGVLIKPTTITTDATNTLAITGLTS